MFVIFIIPPGSFEWRNVFYSLWLVIEYKQLRKVNEGKKVALIVILYDLGLICIVR